MSDVTNLAASGSLLSVDWPKAPAAIAATKTIKSIDLVICPLLSICVCPKRYDRLRIYRAHILEDQLPGSGSDPSVDIDRPEPRPAFRRPGFILADYHARRVNQSGRQIWGGHERDAKVAGGFHR